MQHPTDPGAAAELAAVVDSGTRAPRARLRVDWNHDGTNTHALSDLSAVAGDIVIDRQITGDLPDECTLIEGYTSASLSTTLAGQRPGDPRDIARMLSPHRTDSPLYGQPLVDAPVTCELGMLTASGREMIRQFTGTTRTLTLSAADRSIDLAALDAAEWLRASVTLPPVAQPEAEHYNTEAWPYRWRINTQWVIDYVLRRNGIFASPPPRAECLFAMTCHGGLVADVGYNTAFLFGNAPNTTAPTFVPGPYGLLAANGDAGVSARVAGNAVALFNPGLSGVAHVIEFACKAGDDNTFGPDMNGEIVSIASATREIEGVTYIVGVGSLGTLFLRIYSARTLATTITGPALTSDAVWHRVGLWVRYSYSTETLETRWMLDGQVGPVATASVTIASLTNQGNPDVTISTPVPIQCVQIAEVTDPPADWGAAHIPQAEIDVGLNWMTGLPDLVGVDSFDVLKQAAAAEFGVITVTEDGRFRFANRDTLRALADQPPVKHVTAQASLTALSLSTSLDGVRNEITLTATPRLQTYKDTIIYEPATVDELDIPSGTTWRTVTLHTRCEFTGGALSIMAKDTYTSGPPDSYYSAVRATNRDTGTEVTTGLTITATPLDQEHVELEFRNTNTFVVRFALDEKTPALRLVGYPIINAQTLTHHATDTASIERYGRRALSLPDNPFRQTLDSADTIATSLLADLARPATVLTDVAVVGDPRIQLLDNVTVTDPRGLGGPIPATVIGIRRALNTEDGLADTLTLRVQH